MRLHTSGTSDTGRLQALSVQLELRSISTFKFPGTAHAPAVLLRRRGVAGQQPPGKAPVGPADRTVPGQPPLRPPAVPAAAARPGRIRPGRPWCLEAGSRSGAEISTPFGHHRAGASEPDPTPNVTDVSTVTVVTVVIAMTAVTRHELQHVAWDSFHRSPPIGTDRAITLFSSVESSVRDAFLHQSARMAISISITWDPAVPGSGPGGTGLGMPARPGRI
jgi:hypothetical protein